MYTLEEITKAGYDAGFSSHEVDTLHYQLIENRKLEPLPNGAKPIVKCSLPPDEIISLVDGLRSKRIAGADVAEHLYEWNASIDKVISKLEDAFGGNDI